MGIEPSTLSRGDTCPHYSLWYFDHSSDDDDHNDDPANDEYSEDAYFYMRKADGQTRRRDKYAKKLRELNPRRQYRGEVIKAKRQSRRQQRLHSSLATKHDDRNVTTEEQTVKEPVRVDEAVRRRSLHQARSRDLRECMRAWVQLRKVSSDLMLACSDAKAAQSLRKISIKHILQVSYLQRRPGELRLLYPPKPVRAASNCAQLVLSLAVTMSVMLLLLQNRNRQFGLQATAEWAETRERIARFAKDSACALPDLTLLDNSRLKVRN